MGLHMTVVMCSIRRELSPLEYSVSHSTQAAAYTHAHPNRPLFGKRQRGINTLHFGEQILVLYHKDLVWMNGTPLVVLGIDPGSLDHKPQPLTIGPFLTPPHVCYIHAAIICHVDQLQTSKNTNLLPLN